MLKSSSIIESVEMQSKILDTTESCADLDDTKYFDQVKDKMVQRGRDKTGEKNYPNQKKK